MHKRKRHSSSNAKSAPVVSKSLGANINVPHRQLHSDPRRSSEQVGHENTSDQQVESPPSTELEASPSTKPEPPPSTEPEAQNLPPNECVTKASKYCSVDVIDENKVMQKRKLKLGDVWVLEPGTKVMVEYNQSNQPVGQSGGLLGSFLGAIAANFKNFPICYERWPLVPDTYKDNIYREPIQKKFDVNDGKHKEYILKNLGKKWKDDRCKLFNKYYDFDKSRSQNLQSCPEGIPLDHWASFIYYRIKDKNLTICDKNAANRQKQMVPHTLGSKSMARKQHELEVTDKRTYIRSQMYLIRHKKKDESYVNDEAREKSEQLAVLEREGASSQHTSSDDAFSK